MPKLWGIYSIHLRSPSLCPGDIWGKVDRCCPNGGVWGRVGNFRWILNGWLFFVVPFFFGWFKQCKMQIYSVFKVISLPKVCELFGFAMQWPPPSWICNVDEVYQFFSSRGKFLNFSYFSGPVMVCHWIRRSTQHNFWLMKRCVSKLVIFPKILKLYATFVLGRTTTVIFSGRKTCFRESSRPCDLATQVLRHLGWQTVRELQSFCWGVGGVYNISDA